MALQELNTANFDEAVKEGKVLVDFWAPWCGPCRMLTPTIEELAGEMPDVNFVKVNIDESPELAQKFGVMSIPTLAYLKDGEAKDQTVGVVPKSTIQEKLNSL